MSAMIARHHGITRTVRITPTDATATATTPGTHASAGIPRAAAVRGQTVGNFHSGLHKASTAATTGSFFRLGGRTRGWSTAVATLRFHQENPSFLPRQELWEEDAPEPKDVRREGLSGFCPSDTVYAKMDRGTQKNRPDKVGAVRTIYSLMKGSKAMCRARLIATVSSRWWRAQVPVTRRGMIFARSLK